MDGIINIYKEQGYTSFDVVAKLRGILKQKKIGHTGTLDPLAEGVLLVCLGKATKLVDLLTEKDKDYETVMLLGVETDTEDISGTVIKSREVNVTKEQVVEAILSFVKQYDQIPPMYSAIKKDGKKLYEYARKGIEIEREARPVEIKDIEILDVNIPEVTFRVKCSKGTYIRSLCRDIGNKLQTGATMKSLVRREVNGSVIEDSLKLDQVAELKELERLESYIIPIDSILGKYNKVLIKDEYEKYLRNGNKLEADWLELDSIDEISNIIRVYANDEFLALYKYDDESNIYRPFKMFL